MCQVCPVGEIAASCSVLDKQVDVIMATKDSKVKIVATVLVSLVEVGRVELPVQKKAARCFVMSKFGREQNVMIS